MRIPNFLTRLILCVLSISMGSQAIAERTTTFLHTDGLGSVVAATDESGQVLWRKDYAPYGEQLVPQSNNVRTAYTGKEHDNLIGLTNFGARHYDPEIGRFMSVDPVKFREQSPISFNSYAYANNNPYKFVDPDGRLPILVPIIFLITGFMAADAANAPGHGDVPEPVGDAARGGLGALIPVGSGTVLRQAAARDVATPQVVARGLGNPFKEKSASQIDEMFRKKGFEPRGPDPAGGKGGYVNPKTNRSYHIDEANSFGEPPHVDVNRLRTYDGDLPKKKYPFGE